MFRHGGAGSAIRGQATPALGYWRSSLGQWLASLLLAATVVLAGCGVTGSPPGSGGNGGGGTPSINVSPPTVNFGNVLLGNSSSQAINVSNPGTASLTVSNIVVSGSGFRSSGPALPLTVSAGQSTSFTVSFQPASSGSASGSITITNNATASALVVGLSGTGVTPSSHSVALTWQASTSSGVSYYVYRGMVSGGPYSRLNSSADTGLNYTDNSVVSGNTYFYVVTAVDANGQQSVYSNEAPSGVIP